MSYKIKINSKEHSYLVQYIAFSMGYEWHGTGKVFNPNGKYLYLKANKYLSYGDMDEVFRESSNKEISLEGLNCLFVANNNKPETTRDKISRLEKEIEELQQKPLQVKGYDVEYMKNNQGDMEYVKIGCAIMEYSALHRVFYFNDTESKQNRKISSITLDSGVELTINEITDIIKSGK